MTDKILLSEKMQYLIDYARQEYKDNKGLHLNSKDWQAFVVVGTPLYYSFLINGTIKYHTNSKISGERYDQLIKLSDYKKMEAPLLIMFLLNIPEQNIIDYLSIFMSVSEAKLFCPCKMFQFWGVHYNLTQIGSAYGPDENRPPNIRDPHRNNFACKHLWLVLNSYDNQIKMFSKGLIPYYKRYFGLTSPTGVERTRKQLGIKGMKQVVAQAIKDLNKIGNKKLIDLYNNLTNGKLNDVFKTEIEIKPPKEFNNIETVKEQPAELSNIPDDIKKEAEKEKENNSVKNTKFSDEIEKLDDKKVEDMTPEEMDKIIKDSNEEKEKNENINNATVKDYDSLMLKTKINKNNIIVENYNDDFKPSYFDKLI